MEKAILFLLAVALVGGFLLLVYRSMMQRVEERVMEKVAEAQREQQRQQRTAAGLAPPQSQNNHEAILQEMEGIAPEVLESACADVLSQIADRRKQFRRRPTTRRQVTKPK